MNGETTGRGNRMRLLAVLTLLVVFAAGALVGAAVERGSRHGHARGGMPRGGGPPPMFAEGSPIVERLKLTPVQRDSIERLTARDRARADSVFHHTRRQMRTHFDSTIQAVDAVLTPEQRAEWKRIRDQWHQGASHDDLMRGHGPGGPGERHPGSPTPRH